MRRDFDALDVTTRLIAKPLNSFIDTVIMAQIETTESDAPRYNIQVACVQVRYTP